jgi:hypothetical protein
MLGAETASQQSKKESKASKQNTMQTQTHIRTLPHVHQEEDKKREGQK